MKIKILVLTLMTVLGLFAQENSAESTDNEEDLEIFKVFSVSFNPTIFNRGMIGLYGDAHVKGRFIATLGLGVTLSDAKMHDELYKKWYGLDPKDYDNIYFSKVDLRKSLKGPFLDLEAKYMFFKHNGKLKGLYVSTGLRYRKYNAETNYVFNGSNKPPQLFNMDYFMIEPNTKIGVQANFSSYGEETPFCFNFYLGIGRSFLSAKGYNAKDDYRPYAIQTNRSGFVPFLGLSFGYVFERGS